MLNSDLKIIRTIRGNNIEFCTNKSLEPNSSYEIENCINETINPIKELSYRFDYWFDDNDIGYFVKDNIRVDIHYGVMTDFTFTVENKYSEFELNKIENWIQKIYLCMLQKEKMKMENLITNEISQENIKSRETVQTKVIEKEKIKESYLKRLLKKYIQKIKKI